MENTVHGHCTVFIFVKNGVRKSSHQSATIILVNWRVHLGSTPNSPDACVNATQKIFSKTRALRFVPSIALVNVLLGFWSDNQLSGHGGGEPFV